MSLLAWIDFDEAERERAQRILALGQERDSRDELGMGAIRDSIADRLFPGTSTIQTRLRYMLFIPWIFQKLESKGLTVEQLRAEARVLESKLGWALQEGGETTGVFGREAKEKLQRLPSSVYWAGLRSWGIRQFDGSIDRLFEALRARARWRQPTGEEAAGDLRLPSLWNPSLPPAPLELLDKVTFRLTIDEAQLIIDRLVATHPSTLLTWLARREQAAECQYIWTHPHLKDFPTEARILVQHAEIFSSVMHGASLLYNLTLSELREREDWIIGYQDQISGWADSVDLAAVRAWSLDEFWHSVRHEAHTITSATKRFVTAWRNVTLAGPSQASSSPVARQLIQQREINLKLAQSRYANRGLRDRWGGASGAARMSFRWNEAQSHLLDIAHAE